MADDAHGAKGDAPEIKPPEYTVDPDGLVTFEVGSKKGPRRKVRLEELDGRLQRNADRMTGEDLSVLVSTRALFAIRQLGDKAVKPPRDNHEVTAIEQSLKGRELDQIVAVYAHAFMDAGETLKKE